MSHRKQFHLKQDDNTPKNIRKNDSIIDKITAKFRFDIAVNILHWETNVIRIDRLFLMVSTLSITTHGTKLEKMYENRDDKGGTGKWKVIIHVHSLCSIPKYTSPSLLMGAIEDTSITLLNGAEYPHRCMRLRWRRGWLNSNQPIRITDANVWPFNIVVTGNWITLEITYGAEKGLQQ